MLSTKPKFCQLRLRLIFFMTIDKGHCELEGNEIVGWLTAQLSKLVQIILALVLSH